MNFSATDGFKILVATAFLFVAMSAPVLAAGLSPEGSWQQSNGDTRVRVTLCGDGTELCAKLTWLSEKAKTPENLRDLNGYVVTEAEKTTDNAWKGEVHFNGLSAEGTIKLIGQNTIEVRGCKLGLCRSVKFQRI